MCACMFESVSCVFGTMTFASGGEVVAPDRSDNSHTLSAGWLELARWVAQLQNLYCRLSGGRQREQPQQSRDRGWRGRELAAGSAAAYTGGSWGGGRAWLDGRGPGTKTQPLLWRGRGWGAGGGGGLLLRRLAGLSSVVAPDRGLACGAAGNWQKMAHASSTQCSLAKNSNWPIYNTPSDTGGTDPAI